MMNKIRIIAILSLAIFFSGANMYSGYKVGDTITDFKLKNTDGKMVSLKDYKSAKGFILIFDCNTCPFSKGYRDRIKALHAQYEDKGYPVVAINSNNAQRSPGDSFDKMVAYADEHNYRHAYLYDEDQTIATAFGATNTPQVFLINKEEGELKLVYTGAIDNNTKDANAADKKYVENAVNSLLEGKTPNVEQTKAIGCTIKWAES